VQYCDPLSQRENDKICAYKTFTVMAKYDNTVKVLYSHERTKNYHKEKTKLWCRALACILKCPALALYVNVYSVRSSLLTAYFKPVWYCTHWTVCQCTLLYSWGNIISSPATFAYFICMYKRISVPPQHSILHAVVNPLVKLFGMGRVSFFQANYGCCVPERFVSCTFVPRVKWV